MVLFYSSYLIWWFVFRYIVIVVVTKSTYRYQSFFSYHIKSFIFMVLAVYCNEQLSLCRMNVLITLFTLRRWAILLSLKHGYYYVDQQWNSSPARCLEREKQSTSETSPFTPMDQFFSQQWWFMEPLNTSWSEEQRIRVAAEWINGCVCCTYEG